MGRNNRQRRAAKQRARARRGQTSHSGHQPGRTPENDFTELFGGLLDGPIDERLDELLDGLLDDDDEFDDERATYVDPPAPLTVTDRADGLLDAWLSMARRQSDGGVSRLWAERQLGSVEATVLQRADELLGHRLLAHVARLWDSGWQPRDLLHVTRRIDRRAMAIAADLAVEQLRRSGRLDLAPDAWREQLDAAAAVATSAGLHPVGDRAWTPLTRLVAAGASTDEAVSSLLRLMVRMERLPVLTATLQPPSGWREPGTARATRAAGSGTQQRSGTQPRSSTADGRREKVLTTVRALLAKAESTDHTAEAEALTAKAQDLMTRHAIDEALLHAAADDAIDVRSHRVLIDSPYPYEKVALLNAVAAANRVRVIWHAELAIGTVVGTPVDIDQVELLYTSLLIQATRAMTDAGAQRAGSFDRSPSFRRAFLISYAYRIGERLTEADTAATASYGTELVPVLRRQRQAVDDEFDRLFPDTRESGRSRSYSRRGWEAGREAADEAVFVAGRLAS